MGANGSGIAEGGVYLHNSPSEAQKFNVVQFHKERFQRIYPDGLLEDWQKEKANYFSLEEYQKMTTRAICKEYDKTFAQIDTSNINYADFDYAPQKKEINMDEIKYKSAIM